ncbi:MAG: hypothetical protein HKM93_22850 [Desulfobacteraceae bacterium]|nr:hypothetical protein [Desulfobacteraceae bacterium]
MKSRQKRLLFGILIFIGIIVSLWTLSRYEHRDRISAFMESGNRLAELVALFPMDRFEEDAGRYFMNVMTRHSHQVGLIYCLIHDTDGKTIAEYMPRASMGNIPDHIKHGALGATGLARHRFRVETSGIEIEEFSKPIYENGKRWGTVRIGMKMPAYASRFSASTGWIVMATAAVLVLTLFLAFALVTRVLRPVNTLLRHADIRTPPDPPQKRFMFFNGLRSQIELFREYVDDLSSQHQLLAAKVGVLSYEKQQCSSIIDALEDGLLVTDIQDNIWMYNKQILKLLDKTDNHLLDRSISEAVDDDNILACINRQEVSDGSEMNAFIDVEFLQTFPNDMFRMSITYLNDINNLPVGKLILFRNVTREKLAERSTTEFTAHLSHELITPLTTIKSYSEMLMDGEIDDPETQKEFVNTINDETERLAQMVKDLLNVSQIQLGELTIEKELVRTDWLFEDCIKAIEGEAQKKRIKVLRELPDNFPSILGDKNKLKASIINILGNAVKYTPENGKIRFALNESNGNVVFTITDTGHGIAGEELTHIFEKFYRSEDPNITDQQGTGLGLAITSEIVRLHDGTIDVKSKVGAGTRFTVKIPKEEYYLGQ